MSAPAGEAARCVVARFEAYLQSYRGLTRRARERFEARDWSGVQSASVERLGLYRQATDALVADLRALLGESFEDPATWTLVKERYSPLVAVFPDREVAETFFNSATRRVFATVGVDPHIEFVGSHFARPSDPAPVHETFPREGSTLDLVERVMRRFELPVGWDAPGVDALAVAEEVDRTVGEAGLGALAAVEVLPWLFFRNKGAYVVGRLRLAGGLRPFLLALLNGSGGVYVDAVLLDEDGASLVFSFTRSYFQVEAERPHAVVAFLRSILPGKRMAELYTSLGFNKHGKTELYRDLLDHLASTDEEFEVAPGQRGMVMAVFTMPSFDVVFKVIRDRFAPPKTTTREMVMEKYALVFLHDRAGRLIDAQEFEHLAFERRHFSPALLAELQELAGGSVRVRDDTVAIRHLYTERRITPLDLYVHQAEPEAATRAVVDYGQAIRDLAATNIFTGDILLKNFGVTRHGRVVFYDYDELALVTDCRFRDLPEPRGDEEESAPGAWFYVAEDDIFPEEFLTFLGLPPRLREVFVEVHGDLLRADWWRGVQARIRAGEVIEIFPYPASRRLAHRRV